MLFKLFVMWLIAVPVLYLLQFLHPEDDEND